MNATIVWAIGSLVCAGLVDLTYKRYAMRTRSRGVFLSGMGAIWLVLQLLVAGLDSHALALSTITLTFGLVAGAAVTASNLLLIEALTHLNVSLGSTIYRLNTIAVVVMAYLFLGESISGTVSAGIVSGVIAVLFLYHREGGQARHLSLLFLGVAILAALLRATFGVISKAGLEAGADPTGLLLLGAATWMVGGLVYGLWRERPIKFDRASFGLTVIGGLVVFGTVNTLLLALHLGNASVVIPIANLSFVLALVVGVVWGMERLTVYKSIAMLFAIAAIVLLSR